MPCQKSDVAAGGIFALRQHVSRLAEGLCRLPGVVLDPASVETNIVIFDLTGTEDATRVLAIFFRAVYGSARWDRGPSAP